MLANEEAKITLEDIAKALNRDSSTVCSLLDRFRNKCAQDAELRNLVVKSKKKVREIAELQA